LRRPGKVRFTQRFQSAEGGFWTNLDSSVLNQIRSIDRQRLLRRLGHASPATMERVDQAIQISLGLVRI